MSSNLETEAYEGELRELRAMKNIVRHQLAEKLGNVYFICGESGEKDRNGLPQRILVCPAYGVDWFEVYERTNKTSGPEW
jgi:hypothetical protein